MPESCSRSACKRSAGVVRQLAALLTDLARGPPATTRAAGWGPDRRRVLAPLQPADISLLRQLAAETAADTRRRLAALIADAFWRLFNRPAVISLLRQLPAGTAAVRDESAYWRRVLHYCRQGNLQAVLDEQWHLLWDQRSWSEDASADETAVRCARKARPGGASGARPCPRRVLPGRVRSIRRHRRTRRDPRPQIGQEAASFRRVQSAVRRTGGSCPT